MTCSQPWFVELPEVTNLVFVLDEDLEAACRNCRPADNANYVFISTGLLAQISELYGPDRNTILSAWSNSRPDIAVQSISLVLSVAGIDTDYQRVGADRFMFRTVTA